MKIAVVLGTRPEIIRLYHTIKLLQETDTIELNILYTNQNFEPNLSIDIFEDPRFGDIYDNWDWLDIQRKTSFIEQIGPITVGIHNYLVKKAPDKVLVLGDTNTSLFATLAAKKLGIPIYHMEAGNRCFDPNSPEEVNRRAIDSMSDVHLCYTDYAKQNLIAEGVARNRIHIIGNPIAEFEELHECTEQEDLILATFHRQENVNNITNIISALLNFTKEFKVIACLHPRYLNRVEGAPFEVIPSVNFSDFVKLEGRARVIVTDSGTVCEEAAILGVPSVIIRKTMERPELFDHSCTILSGADDASKIIAAIHSQLYINADYSIPPEYQYQQVSYKVRNILLGKGNYVITS